LGYIKDPRASEPLITALKDGDDLVRCYAAEALGWIKDPRATEPLIAALRDSEAAVRLGAATSLGWIRDPRAIEPLSVALKDADYDVQKAAVASLGEFRDPRAAAALGARAAQVMGVAADYASIIGRGEPGSEDALIEALDAYGNQRMAEVFLNCGNWKLADAARAWAKARGYKVKIADPPGGGLVGWGSSRQNPVQ
jgi:HEAT repeat protein